MSAPLLSTLLPPPRGFAAATLTKQELLAGSVVLLVRNLDEVVAALPGFADRVRGFVVELDDAWRWRQLGPALWHLGLPIHDLGHLADVCTGLVGVLEAGLVAAERAPRARHRPRARRAPI